MTGRDAADDHGDDARQKRRVVRGPLSSMELLPDEAQDDVVWAVRELNARRRSAEDIRFELNDRLAVRGLGPISRSAFGRQSMKLSIAATRLREARYLFEGLADQFTPEKADESSMVIGEMIKLMIFEMSQTEPTDFAPKQAMELAQAHLAVIRGAAVSSDRRLKLEAKFAAQAVKAVDAAAAKAGLSSDTVSTIRASILGIAAPISAGQAPAPAAAPAAP